MAPIRWTRYPRDVDGAWRAIDDLRERIDGMQIADEVAARVEKALKRQRQFELSFLQKAGAVIICLLTMADLAVQILRGASHG